VAGTVGVAADDALLVCRGDAPNRLAALGLLPPNVCSRGATTPKGNVSTARGSSPRTARTWGKPALRGNGAQRMERASLARRAVDGWGC
jgi:hypothetical protein